MLMVRIIKGGQKLRSSKTSLQKRDCTGVRTESKLLGTMWKSANTSLSGLEKVWKLKIKSGRKAKIFVNAVTVLNC